MLVVHYFSYDLVSTSLAFALAHQASENEKLLAQQENLLVPADEQK